MNARLRVATVSSLLLLIAIPTVGQTTSAPAARTAGGCPLASSRTSAGAPYSALQENTLSQTLADGTRIESKQRSIQRYRDSQGRLREEIKHHFFDPAGVQQELLINIMIIDPLDCVVYNLDASAHVAWRHTYAPNEMTPAGPTTEQSNAVKQPAPHAIPEELRPKTSTERLGTDTIEGLLVEGKRETTTYPLGSQGNDRPFVVTHETWTSLVPKLVMLHKTLDPRSGETTERVTNIQLGEPSPTLFQVPADYQIQDQPFN